MAACPRGPSALTRLKSGVERSSTRANAREYRSGRRDQNRISQNSEGISVKAKSMWKISWPFVHAGLRLGASQSAADSELSSAWNWRRVSSSSSRMRCPTSLSLTQESPTSRLHRLVYRRSPRFDSIQEGENDREPDPPQWA